MSETVFMILIALSSMALTALIGAVVDIMTRWELGMDLPAYFTVPAKFIGRQLSLIKSAFVYILSR